MAGPTSPHFTDEGRGHRTRGRSTEMNEESWSPSHPGVYASALWPLCPWRAAQSLCNFRALSLICHFRFFFSFTSLASWASWAFINLIIFLPSGVLKYQSWVRGREGDVALGSASHFYGSVSSVAFSPPPASILLEPWFLLLASYAPGSSVSHCQGQVCPTPPCSHPATLGVATDSRWGSEWQLVPEATKGSQHTGEAFRLPPSRKPGGLALPTCPSL